jgi:hypothetical protein
VGRILARARREILLDAPPGRALVERLYDGDYVVGNLFPVASLLGAPATWMCAAARASTARTSPRRTTTLNSRRTAGVEPTPVWAREAAVRSLGPPTTMTIRLAIGH